MASRPAHPVLLLFRHVLLARLEARYRSGDRVIAIGPAGGEEARVLGARGVRLIEVEGAMVTGALVGGCDGAYATLGALEDVDLRALAPALAAALRPGAALVLTMAGPSPLPAFLRRTLTGLGAPRRRRPTLAEAQRALGGSFVWTDVYALGVLLPGPEHDAWAADHPQAFGLLAALERVVRRWRGLRGRGEYVVLEGRRAEA
jgi:hypothetical protein